MTYAQTLEYLFTRLPMFSRIGAAAFKKDLTNTIRLCNSLGDPQNKFRSIHVAGTNGKGSVSHMLASIFQAAGYKTGLYTSPHLKDFRERIKLLLPGSQPHAEMIPEEFVIRFTEQIKPLIEEIEPSFFEITVAMAFSYFASRQVDIAIVEVGLGGRFDSTNIITPALSVITNIGWDHMNLLGDSLEKIAFEKAGIIKKNVPVVIGEILPQTMPVFEKSAKEKNSVLSIASQKRQIADWRWENHEMVLEVSETHHIDHRSYRLDLTGIYQSKNLLTVLESCSVLQQNGWNIDDASIHKGLGHTRKFTGFHGRWEIIHHNPPVVLDVAHNEDGIRQLVQQVEIMAFRQLHIIIGMVRDKELDSIISLLPLNAEYYFTRAQIPRALPEDELAAKAGLAGLKGDTYPEVNEALKKALEHAATDDLILICGSVYLVGEVREVK